MDDIKWLEHYIKELNGNLKNLEVTQNTQTSILQAQMLQLKGMEIKLEEHIKYYRQQQLMQAEPDSGWKEVAKWALIIIAVLLGLSDKLPPLGGV